MRLIDADALMKCIPREEYGSRFAVANAPTVEVVGRSCEFWDAESNYCALNRPSAQQWTPVSERLPEKGSFALVTDFGDVEEAYYDSDGHWWQVWGDRLKNVTAWMPLPEPYRKETEE